MQSSPNLLSICPGLREKLNLKGFKNYRVYINLCANSKKYMKLGMEGTNLIFFVTQILNSHVYFGSAVHTVNLISYITFQPFFMASIFTGRMKLKDVKCSQSIPFCSQGSANIFMLEGKNQC